MYLLIIYYVIIFLFFKMESKIEKLFRKKELHPKISYEEKNSLRYFKLFKNVICIISSFEFSFIAESRNFIALNITFGMFLVLIGIYLRIIAIYTLGKYWSYNVRILENHEIIYKGIYRFIKHPAYLGNVFILGIFLVSNLYFSLLVSFIFITGFNLWRINSENKLLAEIQNRKLKKHLNIQAM